MPRPSISGGTDDLPGSIGYSVTGNFVSSLFAAHALNGAVSPARFVAIPALFVLCVSLGVVFRRISTTARTKAHRKTIEIAGFGAMVYGFLVATPMHDLMVTIGLVFLLIALVATAHMLYVERQWLLFAWGVMFIALKLMSAAIYYGHVLYGVLPVLQKVGLAVGITWLGAVYYTRVSRESGSTVSAVPSTGSVPQEMP